MSALRWVAVDDADPSIQYSGSGWFQDQGSQNNKGNFGASYRSTLHGTQSNASLSFAFSGTQVKILGFNNPRNDSGVFDPTWECLIDNISIGQNPPSTAVDNYWVLCEHHQLVDGAHIITVNATVIKAQTFWFDQVQYVPSSSVSLDDTAVIVDNTDPAISFGDGWGDLGNFCNATNVANANLNVSFTGVSVSWYSFTPETPHTPTTGSYSVDGEPPVNFLLQGIANGSAVTIEYNQKMFETSQHEPGPHQLVVTYLGNSSTTPLTLDYLIIQNSTSTSTTKSTSSSINHGSSGHSKPTGQIVGGVIGSLVLIGLAVAAFYYFRRWERKQKQKDPAEKEAQYNVDEGTVIEPFHLAPSFQTGTSSNFYANHRPQDSIGTVNAGLFGSKPSQSTAEPKYVISPSATSSSMTPAPASAADNAQGRQSPSSDGHVPTARLNSSNIAPYTTPTQPPEVIVSEKERQEAEATVAALRPQRLPYEPTTSLQPHSTSSGHEPSRVIVHEDSGLRVPRPGSCEGSVVEVPPMYTAG